MKRKVYKTPAIRMVEMRHKPMMQQYSPEPKFQSRKAMLNAKYSDTDWDE